MKSVSDFSHYGASKEIQSVIAAHDSNPGTRNEPTVIRDGAKSSRSQSDDAVIGSPGKNKSQTDPVIKPQNKGKLHKATGTPLGQKIPVSKIEKAEKSKSPALKKEAVFAMNMRPKK